MAIYCHDRSMSGQESDVEDYIDEPDECPYWNESNVPAVGDLESVDTTVPSEDDDVNVDDLCRGLVAFQENFGHLDVPLNYKIKRYDARFPPDLTGLRLDLCYEDKYKNDFELWDLKIGDIASAINYELIVNALSCFRKLFHHCAVHEDFTIKPDSLCFPAACRGMKLGLVVDSLRKIKRNILPEYQRRFDAFGIFRIYPSFDALHEAIKTFYSLNGKGRFPDRYVIAYGCAQYSSSMWGYDLAQLVDEIQRGELYAEHVLTWNKLNLTFKSKRRSGVISEDSGYHSDDARMKVSSNKKSKSVSDENMQAVSLDRPSFELLFAALQRYIAVYKSSHVTTGFVIQQNADFKRNMWGLELGRFFQDIVNNTLYPEYSSSWLALGIPLKQRALVQRNKRRTPMDASELNSYTPRPRAAKQNKSYAAMFEEIEYYDPVDELAADEPEELVLYPGYDFVYSAVKTFIEVEGTTAVPTKFIIPRTEQYPECLWDFNLCKLVDDIVSGKLYSEHKEQWTQLGLTFKTRVVPTRNKSKAQSVYTSRLPSKSVGSSSSSRGGSAGQQNATHALLLGGNKSKQKKVSRRPERNKDGSDLESIGSFEEKILPSIEAFTMSSAIVKASKAKLANSAERLKLRCQCRLEEYNLNLLTQRTAQLQVAKELCIAFENHCTTEYTEIQLALIIKMEQAMRKEHIYLQAYLTNTKKSDMLPVFENFEVAALRELTEREKSKLLITYDQFRIFGTINVIGQKHVELIREALLLFRSYYGKTLPVYYVVPCDKTFPPRCWGLHLGENVSTMNEKQLKYCGGLDIVLNHERFRFDHKVQLTRDIIAVLELYCLTRGNCSIPRSFVIPYSDSYPETVQGIMLGKWLEQLSIMLTRTPPSGDSMCLSMFITRLWTSEKVNNDRLVSYSKVLRCIRRIHAALLVYLLSDPNPISTEYEVPVASIYSPKAWSLKLGLLVMTQSDTMTKCAWESTNQQQGLSENTEFEAMCEHVLREHSVTPSDEGADPQKQRILALLRSPKDFLTLFTSASAVYWKQHGVNTVPVQFVVPEDDEQYPIELRGVALGLFCYWMAEARRYLQTEKDKKMSHPPTTEEIIPSTDVDVEGDWGEL